MRKTYDVVVVGAGMVGMACALGLAQKGFKVALLESQSQLNHSLPKESDPFDNKVVAISRSSEKLFVQLGVWNVMKSARVSSYEHMTVWDSVRDGIIHFSAQELFEPNLGHIIEQRVILSAMWGAIQQIPLISVYLNAKIQTIKCLGEQCEVDLENKLLSATLVIAADGANSCVRNMMHIDSKRQDYQQSAVVATIQGTLSHNATAFQRFAEDGPLAWLPLADPYLTSIVWTTSPDQAAILCSLSSSDFNKKITEESEGKMGMLELVGERFSYPLKSHHAKHYVLPRCVLVGDAAHTLHPLAGMGVNLGFLDCAVLIELLTEAKQSARDFGLASWLKRYERRRRWHNQTMISAMLLFKQGFGSSIPFIQSTRNALLSYVGRQQAIKQFFARWALATNI